MFQKSGEEVVLRWRKNFTNLKKNLHFYNTHYINIMQVGYLPASILMKTLFKYSNLDHFWFVESKTKKKERQRTMKSSSFTWWTCEKRSWVFVVRRAWMKRMMRFCGILPCFFDYHVARFRPNCIMKCGENTWIMKQIKLNCSALVLLPSANGFNFP